jgi:S1-C subfamily serine protease
MRATRCLHVFAATAVLLTVLTAPAGSARAADSLGKLERSFKQAIEKALPATVVCVGENAVRGMAGSSGVIVSRDGLVLSDADVGLGYFRSGKEMRRTLSDTVTVRVAREKEGGFTTYKAKLVRRLPELDTALLRITDPPRGGFPDYLRPASSAELRVGSYTLAAGNAFSMSDEAPPTLTAGVVSLLVPQAKGKAGGPHATIYTSAAVNPGVNGGPLIDIEGRLVATISGSVKANGKNAFQFLGKAVPMDVIRAAYADLPEHREMFGPGLKATVSGTSTAKALEEVFHATAKQARTGIVSIAVKRKAPVLYGLKAGEETIGVPRYQGPYSGVFADARGYVVTSLYNLTNLAALQGPGAGTPEQSTIGGALGSIETIHVHLGSGPPLAYELKSYHEGVNLAVLTPAEGVKVPRGARRPLAVAPPDAFVAGRFVLALGDPFGPAAHDLPLLTVGTLSKLHAPDASALWRGFWQTDAGTTDGLAGGAAVDLEGRLYGVLQIWDPLRHGRNSGIGFVLPWTRVEEVLPEMLKGRTYARPFMGVQWDVGTPPPRNWNPSATPPRIQVVVPDSAAAKAGLLPGDLLIEVDGEKVEWVADVGKKLIGRWSGDALKLRVRRGEKELDLDVVLGARP